MHITPCELGPTSPLPPLAGHPRVRAECACGTTFGAWDDAHMRDKFAEHLAIAKPFADVLEKDAPTAIDVHAWPEFFITGPGRAIASQTPCPHEYRLTDSCPGCDADRDRAAGRVFTPAEIDAAHEFARRYIERSRMSGRLIAQRRVVIACGCDYDGCEGWGMVPRYSAVEDAIPFVTIPMPVETVELPDEPYEEWRARRLQSHADLLANRVALTLDQLTALPADAVVCDRYASAWGSRRPGRWWNGQNELTADALFKSYGPLSLLDDPARYA